MEPLPRILVPVPFPDALLVKVSPLGRNMQAPRRCRVREIGGALRSGEGGRVGNAAPSKNKALEELLSALGIIPGSPEKEILVKGAPRFVVPAWERVGRSQTEYIYV